MAKKLKKENLENSILNDVNGGDEETVYQCLIQGFSYTNDKFGPELTCDSASSLQQAEQNAVNKAKQYFAISPMIKFYKGYFNKNGEYYGNVITINR